MDGKIFGLISLDIKEPYNKALSIFDKYSIAENKIRDIVHNAKMKTLHPNRDDICVNWDNPFAHISDLKSKYFKNDIFPKFCDQLKENDLVLCQTCEDISPGLDMKAFVVRWCSIVFDHKADLLINSAPLFSTFTKDGQKKNDSEKKQIHGMFSELQKIFLNLPSTKKEGNSILMYSNLPIRKEDLKKYFTLTDDYWLWQKDDITIEELLKKYGVSKKAFYNLASDFESTFAYAECLKLQRAEFASRPKRGALPEKEAFFEAYDKYKERTISAEQLCHEFGLVSIIDIDRIMLAFRIGRKRLI